MRRLYHQLRSQIQYMIILPYMVLMVLVMLLGSGLAITLIADNWQERFDNQLGQVARNFSESFAQREISNISFLEQVAFSARNDTTGAPSIADAMRDQDVAGLKLALQGWWHNGRYDQQINQDRLIIFDTKGIALTDWEHNPSDINVPVINVGTDVSTQPLVKMVLNGQLSRIPGSNDDGDKYSGLISFGLNDQGQERIYFFTVTPVYASTSSTEPMVFVGGILVAQRLDLLLEFLQNQSQASISTVYDVNGSTLTTTVSGVGLDALDIDSALMNRLVALNNPTTVSGVTGVSAADSGGDPCLDIGRLSGRLVTLSTSTQLPACSVNTTANYAKRDYQLVYAPLLIRGVQSGYFSVGLSRDFVVSAWANSRSMVLSVTAVLAVSAVFVGYLVARRITRPLGDLVDTAAAVTSGDLARRSLVVDTNELGQLSHAFNQMTEHLLRLYTTSRELNRTIEIDEVLAVVTQSAQSFVSATEAIALIPADEAYVFRLRLDVPAHLEALRNQHLPADHPFLLNLSAYDNEANQPIRIESEQAVAAGLDPAIGIQQLYAAPLFRQRRFSGALIFALTDSTPVDDAQLQSLAVITNMALAVLSNAVLYVQVQQDAKQRQAILTSISDGVVVCDPSDQIMLLNRAAELILDLEDWRHNRIRFGDLPLEPVPQQREMFGNRQDAQFSLGERYITLSRAPVLSEDGQVLGTVIVLHDITAAVLMDQAKTDFIATISHELRTPLTVIRGYTDLLLRGRGEEAPTPDQAELLEQVRSRAVDMTNMVNNAILIADIESGQLRTELEPQDVEMVLSMALMPLRHGFEAKNLAITVDMPPDLPLVLADREQLKRAFGQLLDNAMRYTDRGGVTIQAAITDDGHVRIDFTDTGNGIPPEMLPRLFKRFQRVEGNNSAQRGGGLGLAITRQLIERHGGKVNVNSTPGQGSTFTITLLQANEHSLAVA